MILKQYPVFSYTTTGKKLISRSVVLLWRVGKYFTTAYISGHAFPHELFIRYHEKQAITQSCQLAQTKEKTYKKSLVSIPLNGFK